MTVRPRPARGVVLPFLLAVLFILCAACPWQASPVHAAGRSLAIDMARVDPSCRSPVYAKPDRSSRVVSKDTACTYLVDGIVTNAQGRWYEVIYPIRGWMRELDARFSGPEGYDPQALPEEQRILLRLVSDVGHHAGRWKATLGTPWSSETWKEREEGEAEVEVTTAIWPGVAIATKKEGGLPDEAAAITRATVCARAPVGFGIYALGEPGSVLRNLDAGFEPAPFAVFAAGNFRAVLDADANISFLAYSATGRDFLACPELGMPDPEEPFYPGSVYPEAWCRRQTLHVGLVAEGEFAALECDDDCTAEIRLDSGASRVLFTSEDEAARWLGEQEGRRVRAIYNVEQDWDEGRRACIQSSVLQSGRVLEGSGRDLEAGQRACRPMVVAQGEAQGVITRMAAEAGGTWELLLDSDRPMAFRGGDAFPGKQELKEGMRVAVPFERILQWDAEDGVCGVATVAKGPARVLGE